MSILYLPATDKQLIDLGLRRCWIYFRGNGYGEVFTAVPGTNQKLRLESMGMHDIAQLLADVRGLDQPCLYQPRETAKWLWLYGTQNWGTRFSSAASAALCSAMRNSAE